MYNFRDGGFRDEERENKHQDKPKASWLTRKEGRKIQLATLEKKNENYSKTLKEDLI